MAYTLDVGKTVNLAIEYLDQNGQPMELLPQRATPAWAQLDNTVQDLIASADGESATATGLKAGTDTVQVTVVVGGQTFTATMNAEVVEVVPTQTLTSIAIIATPA